MEAHYNGHVIRVSAVRVPQTGCWRFLLWIHWNLHRDTGAKAMLHHGLEFETPAEALQAGVDFAMKWIDDGKQDFFKER